MLPAKIANREPRCRLNVVTSHPRIDVQMNESKKQISGENIVSLSPTAAATRVIDTPVPVWLVRITGVTGYHPPCDFVAFGALREDLIYCAFRGVDVSRLPTVLRTGIDVEPSDSVIFVDGFEKAWEYGGMPKVILALDWECLQGTWHEMPSTASAAEVNSVKALFRTQLLSDDKKRFWFSRLNQDDPRIASEYETAYARWIPGNPLEAIRAILIFGKTEHEPGLLSLLDGP